MGRSALFRSIRRLMKRAHVANATGSHPSSSPGRARPDAIWCGGVFGAAALAAARRRVRRQQAGWHEPDRSDDRDHRRRHRRHELRALPRARRRAGAGLRGVAADRRAHVHQARWLRGRPDLRARRRADRHRSHRHAGARRDLRPAARRSRGRDRRAHRHLFHFNGACRARRRSSPRSCRSPRRWRPRSMAGDASADEFDRIDQMSIPQWLATEANLPGQLDDQASSSSVAYLEEFGLEVAEQSAWNLITLIDYATPDPFHVFGDSDERYHLHQGSDSIAPAHRRAARRSDHARPRADQGRRGRRRLRARRSRRWTATSACTSITWCSRCRSPSCARSISPTPGCRPSKLDIITSSATAPTRS